MAEDNKKILATFRVTGKFTVEMSVSDYVDVAGAVRVANEAFTEADFGELRDIDADIVCIEPDEQYLPGIDFTDPVVCKAYEEAGTRERYAMLFGTPKDIDRGGKKLRVFTYAEENPYQDANGAVYDLENNRWIG